MIAQLTKGERSAALIILAVLAVVGLLMAGVGRDDPLGAQGALVLVAAVAGIFGVISGYFEPEPGEDRRGLSHHRGRPGLPPRARTHRGAA